MTNLEPGKTNQQEIAKKVYEAFFGPSRYEVKPATQALLECGRNYPARCLAYARLGQGTCADDGSCCSHVVGSISCRVIPSASPWRIRWKDDEPV